MVAFTASISILVFVAALWLLRIVPLATSAISASRRALETLGDKALDDLDREKAMQSASLSLLKIFFSILIRGCLALLASLLPIWLADRAGIADGQGVVEFLSRIDVILVASVVLLAIYFLARRARPSK